jgi:hypothetical protein
MNLEVTLDGVDNEDRKKLISELEAKKKIPKSLQRQFLSEKTVPMEVQVERSKIPAKRKH